MQSPYSKNPVLNVKEVYFKLSHMSCCLLHRRFPFRPFFFYSLRKQKQKMKNRQQTRRLLLRNLAWVKTTLCIIIITNWWFFCKRGFTESLRLRSIHDFSTRNSPSSPKSLSGCLLIPLSSAIIMIIIISRRPDWADSVKSK